MKNLDYLRAEMAMARSQGAKRVLVDINELQSLIDRFYGVEEGQRAKILGFASGVESRNLISGHCGYLKIRRKKTVVHSTPVFFTVLSELNDEEKLRLLGVAGVKRSEAEQEA